MSAPDLRPTEVFYPESDGKPMAESDLHRDLMLDLIAAARHHFRQTPDVYVSGNLLLYFEKGNPRASISPDFFVVRGIPKGRRRVFKLWEEGNGPEAVVELTSPSTHREDLKTKHARYESLGVLEYYIFDPEGRRFQPPFRGFRLEEGILRPVAAERGPGGALVYRSAVMGLELHARGESLRLVDPRTGQPVPVPEELLQAAEEEHRRAEEEHRRAEEEHRRADAAEAALARAREEIERLRSRPER